MSGEIAATQLDDARRLIKTSGLPRATMQDLWDIFLEDCAETSFCTAMDKLSQAITDEQEETKSAT